MGSTVWHTVRAPSVLALTINNKWSFLLFLRVRPIREEKMNEMQSFHLRASEFSSKGRHRQECVWLRQIILSTINVGRNKERGMWKTRGRRDPQWDLESLAYYHTVILSYLICKMGMILFLHQFYLQCKEWSEWIQPLLPVESQERAFLFPEEKAG